MWYNVRYLQRIYNNIPKTFSNVFDIERGDSMKRDYLSIVLLIVLLGTIGFVVYSLACRYTETVIIEGTVVSCSEISKEESSMSAFATGITNDDSAGSSLSEAFSGNMAGYELLVSINDGEEAVIVQRDLPYSMGDAIEIIKTMTYTDKTKRNLISVEYK